MHLTHLIGNETIFQARASEMLDGSEPEFERWDSPAWAAAHQDRSISLTDLGSRFVDEREKTARIFEDLRPAQWAHTATWPDGTVIDLAWLGEKVLWHGLEHLAYLLDVHGEWEPRQAGR